MTREIIQPADRDRRTMADVVVGDRIGFVGAKWWRGYVVGLDRYEPGVVGVSYDDGTTHFHAGTEDVVIKATPNLRGILSELRDAIDDAHDVDALLDCFAQRIWRIMPPLNCSWCEEAESEVYRAGEGHDPECPFQTPTAGPYACEGRDDCPHTRTFLTESGERHCLACLPEVPAGELPEPGVAAERPVIALLGRLVAVRGDQADDMEVVVQLPSRDAAKELLSKVEGAASSATHTTPG